MHACVLVCFRACCYDCLPVLFCSLALLVFAACLFLCLFACSFVYLSVCLFVCLHPGVCV